MITFFEKTNVPRSRVLAYHHPKSITWRWAIWFSLNKKLIPGIYPYRDNNGLQFSIQLLPFIHVAIMKQDHMWRTK